eukprot:GHVQ01040640.1.p1 GENE.GHVQ01040640.1~~GHVQ01040640.1.p1  ORF type:complete len:225 (-),score=38.85 GHVQ01040640.1:448-1122(-)
MTHKHTHTQTHTQTHTRLNIAADAQRLSHTPPAMEHRMHPQTASQNKRIDRSPPSPPPSPIMVRDKERNRHSGSWLRRGAENRLLKKLFFGGLYALVILSGHLVTPCIIPSFPILGVRAHDVNPTSHDPPSDTVPNSRLLERLNFPPPAISDAEIAFWLFGNIYVWIFSLALVLAIFAAIALTGMADTLAVFGFTVFKLKADDQHQINEGRFRSVRREFVRQKQ